MQKLYFLSAVGGGQKKKYTFKSFCVWEKVHADHLELSPFYG